MKISIVTAALNSAGTIERAIQSVRSQTHDDVEHIVIDGASNDGTVRIAKSAIGDRGSVISQPDSGIYDALNKGVALASGDVIGFLHSDDSFAHSGVLQAIVDAFESDARPEIVFGGLKYVNTPNGRVFRNWQPRKPKKHDLALGWMPPHPTVFATRDVYERYGAFDTAYKISGDYEWTLRVFANKPRCVCLKDTLTLMSTGGASNGSAKAISYKMREDIEAIATHKVGPWPLVLFAKNFRKLHQLVL